MPVPVETTAGWKTPAALAVLLGLFFGCHALLPLRTAVQIGADEGFELAKALLCLKHCRLYTEVWNDQPPLHTFLVTETLRHLSPSILGPRLISVVSGGLILVSLFLLVRRVEGLRVAVVAAVLCLAAPAFIELSASCMLEIPALGLAMAALAWLPPTLGRRAAWRAAAAGVAFGLALQVKLTAGLLLPAAAVALWGLRKGPDSGSTGRTWAASGLAFLAGLVAAFASIHVFLGNQAYFRQLWASHFGVSRSFEYGSAAEHPFDWGALLRNWDTTLPGVVGIAALLGRGVRSPPAQLPLVWLAVAFGVQAIHRPWWPYYYVHLAVPLAWVAAVGLAAAARRLRSRPPRVLAALVALAAACWIAARVGFQIGALRDLPRTYACLALEEIRRYKPYTRWMYCSEPIHSFHAGIPMPPTLAVVPLKRLWSGDMTNARAAAEMERIKPGIVLLSNDGREPPFSDLLRSEYRIVYLDADCVLYVNDAVRAQAGP